MLKPHSVLQLTAYAYVLEVAFLQFSSSTMARCAKKLLGLNVTEPKPPTHAAAGRRPTVLAMPVVEKTSSP